MKAWQLVEKGWTRHAFARYSDGRAVPYQRLSPDEPVCWCAVGAVHSAYSRDSEEWSCAIHRLGSATPPGYLGIPEWNDAPERTQAEVVTLLKGIDV